MTHKRPYTAAGMCVFVSTRLLLNTYAIVGGTSQCNVTTVLVTKPLLRLIHALS